MKKKFLISLLIGLFVLSMVSVVNATTFTFDTVVTPGITLGDDMIWSDLGGGHLYVASFNDGKAVINFDDSIYLKDFQMNDMPFEAVFPRNFFIRDINIVAKDHLGVSIWEKTILFSGALFNADWNNWQTISVEAADVAQLSFVGINSPIGVPGIAIDNIRISEDIPDPVPEPSTIMLMGIGLLGLAGYGKKWSKK